MLDNIINEINILENADPIFVEEVIKLEAITDRHKKATEALDFLNKYYNNFKHIDYTDLRSGLSDYKSCSIKFWRFAYLVERSICRRENDNSSWIDRLKIFTDTNLLETSLNRASLASLPGKIRFSRYSGSHDKLEFGNGKFAADFYCWDEKNNKNYAFVEFKHSNDYDINRIKNYYSESKIRYNARFVLTFTKQHKYYLIDYDTNNITEQNLSIPNGLLIW